MKNIVVRGLLTIAALAFLGMGTNPPGEIPSPKKDYRATIIDSDGVKFEVTQISFHGEIFLDGRRGKALIAIPFDKISRLDFSAQERKGDASEEVETGYLNVSVRFKDKSSTDVLVRKALKWYGKSRLGNLTIKTEDLKAIEFSP